MPGKIGHKQQRALDFLARIKKPHYFCCRTAENRRIVDSLERRGLVDVWRDSPSPRYALVTLRNP